MTDLYRIYIDDSGNVDATTTNAPETRFGSVTAVLMGAHYLDTRFNASFEMLSKRHFGERPDGSPHNIHRRLIAKPPEQGPFSVLREPERRAAWDIAALRMFAAADYTVITAVIDKVAWYYQFPDWRGDFYEVLVQATLERAWYFLKNRKLHAEVNIEHKSPDKNERIKAAYRKALIDGFEHIRAERLRAHFTSLESNIITKDQCRPGMQLVDLIAAPAMHHIRHIHTRKHPVTGEFTVALTDILERKKFYREAKGPSGYGRMWRPKT